MSFRPLRYALGRGFNRGASGLVLDLIYSKDFEIRLLGFNKRTGLLISAQSLDINHLGFEIRTNPFN